MARYGVSTEESVPRVTTASRTTLSDNQRLHHAISPGLFRYVSYSALGYLICLPSVWLTTQRMQSYSTTQLVAQPKWRNS